MPPHPYLFTLHIIFGVGVIDKKLVLKVPPKKVELTACEGLREKYFTLNPLDLSLGAMSGVKFCAIKDKARWVHHSHRLTLKNS